MNARPRIVIVNSSSFGRAFPECLKRLKAVGPVRRVQATPLARGRALAARIGKCEAIVASVQPCYEEEFFRRSPDLVLLARHGIGVNNVDARAATRHGVMLTKVAGVVEREAMAEHTIGLMLAAARRLLPAHAAVARGEWASRTKFIGVELKGRTVGLIGFGNIGSAVGRMLVRGFGARVLACDPAVSAARMAAQGARRASLATLLRRSDVVSLHASLDPTSRGIIGAAALKRMRRGAVLVNTARGELIVERALAAALRSGRVSGFGADVVASEPATARHPYLRLPNVVLVPHIGAYTVESLGAMGAKMVADVEDVFRRRRRPAELVNPEVWRSPNLKLRRWLKLR